MFNRSLLSVAWIVCIQSAGAATLRPLDVATFFVAPDEPAVLQWKVESGRLDGPIEYAIRDYWDKTVDSGRAKIADDGTLEVAVELPQGFYDVELPDTKQRFGVVSLPPYAGRKDPFFCIDSALSWLQRSNRIRDGLIRGLKRCGVAMSRERLNWGDISRMKDGWNWEGSVDNETVRKLHQKRGVEVLEMFHGATSWSGRVGKYPEDLIGTARAWGQIARRWQPTWGAMEVWNEPDIHFGDHLPADQYVPLVRAIAYGFSRQQIDTPVIGGVFAIYNRTFLDNAAENGMLDCVDAVSFHTYNRAPQMVELVSNYRSWLQAHGRPAMPLWITECGRPWKRGPGRPPVDQDAESALDITMKAVEARAAGVARHFPFVYPFYEEREWNFGMMGRRATPLRSMAAYAQMIRRLAHTRYLGDLKCDDDSIQRARLFGDDSQTIAVLYTGRVDRRAKVKPGPAVLRAEGIDGRPLTVEQDLTVPAGDGLVYAWLDRERLGDRLETDTAAMRLWEISRQPPPKRPALSPIVMRLEIQPDLLSPKSDGYHLSAKAADKLPLRVRVFNLSDRPRQLALKLEFSSKPARVIGERTRPVKVPAEAFADVSWQAELSGAFAGPKRFRATVTATSEDGPQARLAIDLAPRGNGVGSRFLQE